MNTRHSWKISRNAAERLLDGHAGAESDPLARVLAAAAAPARESELAGEEMAVAAFEAHHLAPVAIPQKEHKSMLAKLLTAKILFSSLAACATGGVALAASTGALTGPASPHATATASQPAPSATQPGIPVGSTPSADASTPGAVASTQPAAPAANPTGSTGAGASPTASASPTANSLPQGATALCKALIGDVNSRTGTVSGQVQALSSPVVSQVLNNAEFSSLVSTAQSVAAVPDYCALLLQLPQLPQPSELAQLPGALLGQLLTALPTTTLAQILTSLPSSTLGQVLTALPTAALSQILTSLPASVVSQLLNELPASVLAQLPASVLSLLPSSVLSTLPTSVLSGLGL